MVDWQFVTGIPWNWPKFMEGCWSKYLWGMYILANCYSCCLLLSASFRQNLRKFSFFLCSFSLFSWNFNYFACNLTILLIPAAKCVQFRVFFLINRRNSIPGFDYQALISLSSYSIFLYAFLVDFFKCFFCFVMQWFLPSFF